MGTGKTYSIAERRIIPEIDNINENFFREKMRVITGIIRIKNTANPANPLKSPLRKEARSASIPDIYTVVLIKRFSIHGNENPIKTANDPVTGRILLLSPDNEKNRFFMMDNMA